MLQTVLNTTKDKMEASLKSLQNELGKLRTGRASLAVLDGIRVDYYGTPTPINQVASLAVPEARLITVQPWETNLIPAIEKAILEANLGLTPASDGKIVRLPIPKLTEERRKDIVKQVKGFGEEAKVGVRHVRKDAMDQIKKLKSDSKITEDEQKRGEKDVQKITDDYVAKVDGILVKKEEDIMTV
jgi:ribosome recycling factor